MTISATFTATPHPARSPCVANETQSILTTSVAAILKIADAHSPGVMAISGRWISAFMQVSG